MQSNNDSGKDHTTNQGNVVFHSTLIQIVLAAVVTFISNMYIHVYVYNVRREPNLAAILFPGYCLMPVCKLDSTAKVRD